MKTQDLNPATDIEKLLEELLIMSRGVIYYWCIRNGEINVRDYIYHMAEGYLQAYLANTSIFVIIIQNRYTYDADSTKFTEK
ncbi:MAG: hypothetical protein ACLRL6_12675 [Clostridium sp.]